MLSSSSAILSDLSVSTFELTAGRGSEGTLLQELELKLSVLKTVQSLGDGGSHHHRSDSSKTAGSNPSWERRNLESSLRGVIQHVELFLC
jgi:hypothetical protein